MVARKSFRTRVVFPVLTASFKSERVFSVAWNTVTPKRATLNPEKVEDLVVVKCNLELLRIMGMRHKTCLFFCVVLTDLNFQTQLKHIKCFDNFRIHFLTDLTLHLFNFSDCICLVSIFVRPITEWPFKSLIFYPISP